MIVRIPSLSSNGTELLYLLLYYHHYSDCELGYSCRFYLHPLQIFNCCHSHLLSCFLSLSQLPLCFSIIKILILCWKIKWFIEISKTICPIIHMMQVSEEASRYLIPYCSSICDSTEMSLRLIA